MPVETPPAVHSTGSVVAAMVGLAVNGCSAKELRQAAQKRRAVIRFIVEFRFHCEDWFEGADRRAEVFDRTWS
jgi:hypothetical protein